jgi:nucleotidyltransferase/DNA polymerase involved in DNA repair
VCSDLILSYIIIITIPKQQPRIELTMPHTFHSERALTEQLHSCETFLKNVSAAYNNVSSQLSEAENHTPNKHEIDTIRFTESVYRFHSVSAPFLGGGSG